MRNLFIIMALVLMVFGTATAGQLEREDFDGVEAETFEGYAIEMADNSVDFGAFTLNGWFDSDAYQMPVAEPVVRPAIGGDSVEMVLTPPTSRIGFDMGAQWAGVGIVFIGMDDDIEVVLGQFVLDNFAEEGSGPNGYGYQDFVGWEDDEGRDIHRVLLGSGDNYFDNVHIGEGEVATEEATWSGVKKLYR